MGSQTCPLLTARTWVYSQPLSLCPQNSTGAVTMRGLSLGSSERGEGGQGWECPGLSWHCSPALALQERLAQGRLSSASPSPCSVSLFLCLRAWQLQALISPSLRWQPWVPAPRRFHPDDPNTPGASGCAAAPQPGRPGPVSPGLCPVPVPAPPELGRSWAGAARPPQVLAGLQEDPPHGDPGGSHQQALACPVLTKRDRNCHP